MEFEDVNTRTKGKQETEATTNGCVSQTDDRYEEKHQIFEAVYDDIYEVVLPNTNWGIHRDPEEERRYIAFTLFDANKMNCSVAVKITDTFDLHVYANGVHKTSETLPELSVDILTKLVNQLNENAEQEIETKLF